MKNIDRVPDSQLSPFGSLLMDVSIPSDPEQKNNLLEFMVHLLIGSHIIEVDMGVVVRLCLDEALVNAIVHGNDSDIRKKVNVQMFADGQNWGIIIGDEGGGFKDEEVPDQENPDSLELEHGRGVHIIQNFMDKTVYNEKGNRIMMVKSLAVKASA